MSTLRTLYEIPLPSTSIEHTDFCGGILHYHYVRDGEYYRGGIRFKRVPAYRFRAERCSTVPHFEGAYDTLVEVEDSDWVKEIYADTDKLYRDRWEMHHYKIYLDSGGLYEVIAESWEVLPEREGTWPMISPT